MAAGGPDPGRRAWLRGLSPEVATQRPPWALAESEFLERCSRCSACVSVCPTRLLARGDGGFPERLAAAGECSFCGDCVRACVPAALNPAAQPQAWACWMAVIGPQCLVSRGIVCQSCRDSCPEAALRFTAGLPAVPPSLDAARCTACGACVAVCPARAIELKPRPALP